MWDGHWTSDIRVPEASTDNIGRNLTIDHNAGYKSRLYINGQEISVSKGFKKSFKSDGQSWIETPLTDFTVARQPLRFGVPVMTLVGYYDPQGGLPSYIYPPLYGAYGFTYPDDSLTLSGKDCQLQVETHHGLLYFKLANHRVARTVMNKFHINVPTDIQPSRVAVVCNNRTAVEKILPSSAAEDISHFMYGEAFPNK